MKAESKKIRHGGKVVSTIEVPIYETVDELTQGEQAVAPATILALFNKANVIRLQGNERNKFTERKAGKSKRRIDAGNLLTSEELAQYAGNFEELQTFLEGDEMQARLDAQYAEAGVPAEEVAD